MFTLAPVRVRPEEPAVPPSTAPSRDSRWSPAVTMLAGGLVLFAAAGLAVGARGDTADVVVPAPVNVPAGPLAITLSGPGDVTVLQEPYEPGKTSGWHAHPGIHAVAVLSGTLTIYDGRCQAQTFGPGDSYVGGQENHLVSNESAVPVRMVVTYLNPAGPQGPTRQLPPPPGCTAGVQG